MNTTACIPPQEAFPVIASLHQALVKALGTRIGVACTGVDGDPELLWPGEMTTIRRAVPRRQREFAAGRAAARQAMTRIGWPPSAIPSAPDRSPVWPEGMVGSIAHTGRLCVAITGRRNQVHAMGIDIEEDLPLDPALWASICTPEELSAMASLPPSEGGHWVTQLFCAKEAFYKWQYPQTKRMLDFQDVQITMDQRHSRFFVHQATSAKSPVLTCQQQGHLTTIHGLTLAWLIGAPA